MNRDLTLYRVALWTAIVAGTLLLVGVHTRPKPKLHIIVPKGECYTWSDGYRQCSRPVEIEI